MLENPCDGVPFTVEMTTVEGEDNWLKIIGPSNKLIIRFCPFCGKELESHVG